MAPRANLLEDSGESSSENWEKPLGSADVHVVVTALAPDAERLEAVLKRARRAYQDYRASRQSGGRIVMFCQVRRKRSVSRMGSVTLLSKGVVFPSRTDTILIKCGGVRAWIPRRNQRCAFDASTRNSGTKRELRCFSQAT